MLNPENHAYMLQTDPELWRKFKEKCLSEGHTIAYVLRQFIAKYLSDQEG